MRGLALAVAVSMTSGCASILSDQVYPVRVTSEPAQASYEIRDQKGAVISTGMTPDIVSLTAHAGYFDGERYTFVFRKEGFNDSRVLLNSGIDGWYWGNLLVGGVLGMLIVDPVTGAMYTLPKKAEVTLTPLVITQPAPENGQPINYSTASRAMSAQGLSKQQQINLLTQQNLSYEDYQARYQAIMAE